MPMHETCSLVRPNALRGTWSGPVLVNFTGGTASPACAGAPARASPAPSRPAAPRKSRRSGPGRVGLLGCSVMSTFLRGLRAAGFLEQHFLDLLLGGVQREP